MAEQMMHYRFIRTFIVEGLLGQEGQEIVLSDEPGEGRKFVLAGSPDSWLADADKSAAVGAITMSRFTVACAPPPPPPRPVRDIINDIRLQRRNHLKGRMVLVCQFEGTADEVSGSPAEREGERFFFSHSHEINKITEEHEKEIDRATASLFAADASVVAFEPLGLSFRIIAADGSESLVLGLGAGPAVVITRRGLNAEKAVQLKSRFERCFHSDKDLKTVKRLLSDSLLAQTNKLRSFLSAWTALEIFIKKFVTKEEMPPDDERRKVVALINWFNSLCSELGVENPAAKAASFKKIKDVRQEVFHQGKDIDDSAFPIAETQDLVRAFLEKVG